MRSQGCRSRLCHSSVTAVYASPVALFLLSIPVASAFVVEDTSLLRTGVIIGISHSPSAPHFCVQAGIIMFSSRSSNLKVLFSNIDKVPCSFVLEQERRFNRSVGPYYTFCKSISIFFGLINTDSMCMANVRVSFYSSSITLPISLTILNRCRSLTTCSVALLSTVIFMISRQCWCGDISMRFHFFGAFFSVGGDPNFLFRLRSAPFFSVPLCRCGFLVKRFWPYLLCFLAMLQSLDMCPI